MPSQGYPNLLIEQLVFLLALEAGEDQIGIFGADIFVNQQAQIFMRCGFIDPPEGWPPRNFIPFDVDSEIANFIARLARISAFSLAEWPDSVYHFHIFLYSQFVAEGVSTMSTWLPSVPMDATEIFLPLGEQQVPEEDLFSAQLFLITKDRPLVSYGDEDINWFSARYRAFTRREELDAPGGSAHEEGPDMPTLGTHEEEAEASMPDALMRLISWLQFWRWPTWITGAWRRYHQRGG